MDKTPPEKLEAIEGVEKLEDETLKEFVERVGQEATVDPALLDEAIGYIMEWHYSDAPPAEDAAFREFLEALQNGTDGDAGTIDHASDQQTTGGTPTRTETGPVGIQSVEDLETKDISAGFRSGLEGKEPRRLLLTFLGVVLTAPVLGWMMGRAWVPGHQLYDQGQNLLTQALGLDPIQSIELVGMFALGAYVSVLVLFTFDVKKRVQGMLLTIGSILALGVLWAMGVFLPAVDPTPLNGFGAVLGFVIGLSIEGGELLAIDVGESTLKRPTRGDGTVPEFRYAALTIFGLLSIAVLVTVLQAVLANVVQPWDVPAAIGFLILLFQFIRYESETDYMTLGPARSGKSMMTLGLCQELVHNSDMDPDPNAYLQDGLERTSNLQKGDERWPIPSTPRDEVQIGSFEVISGSYFPRRLEMRAMDYAGQHLGRIAELFANDDVDPSAETVPQTVANGLRGADTLLFLLDVERLVFPEEFQERGVTDETDLSWGLEHYGTILDHTAPDDIVVVATKCDILVDQREIDPPSAYDSFEEFRAAVTDHLSSRPDVQQLLQTTGESTIHPVEFATTKRDNQYLPYLDDDGNLVPVGYDHLVDELRSRQ